MQNISNIEKDSMTQKLFMILFFIYGGVFSYSQISLFYSILTDSSYQLSYTLFGISSRVLLLLGLIIVILLLIGAIQCIISKKLEFKQIFYYPVYYFFVQAVFYNLLLLLSTEATFFNFEFEWYYILYRFFSLFFLIYLIYYFLAVHPYNDRIGDVKIVSRNHRFFNFLIDAIHICLFVFAYIPFLANGWIFQDVPLLNSSPIYLLLFYMLIYYFSMELVFLQTIGKLHNNSFVQLKKGRFVSVLIRTLARFIPLEPFSFFNDEDGWHDELSKTQVVCTEKKYEPKQAEV